MERIKLSVLIWEEEGIFVSKCPELEVSSSGDTPTAAVENLKEAIELWFVNAKELGILDDYQSILTSQIRFTSTIEIEI